MTIRFLYLYYPERGLQERKDAEVKEHLAAVKANMSKRGDWRVVEQTKRLKIRQETPDSEEALASIPLLELSDLNPNIEAVERRESKIGNNESTLCTYFHKRH